LAEAAFATAIHEITRIEARYSRYRTDSLLATINAAWRVGGSITVDAETAGLLEYAFACFRLINGLFDVTSGLLRRIWNFKSRLLPSQQAIVDVSLGELYVPRR
jgi:FAD:protein FMN transferase